MTAINVLDVTKRYRIGVGRGRVREMIPPPFDRGIAATFPRWWNKNTFNALEDVSLVVPRGASFGIVGHNGAGKTTLLKVIARVTAPTSGDVRVNGRMAALIDALVGFHPELTGRENVYLLGAMHGFSRRSMASRLERVMEFAEIDELIDTPVKRFSAGMAARLGFGVLTSLDVDILLIDEILAVGDSAFQRKCIDWLDGYRRNGGTLLFVSHNLGLIRNMTDNAAWFDHGKLVAQGPTPQILSSYAQSLEGRDSQARAVKLKRQVKHLQARGAARWGTGGARVESVHVSDPNGQGSDLALEISYVASEVAAATFCVGFIDEEGRQVAAVSSARIPNLSEEGVVRCAVDPAVFRAGIYFPAVSILGPDSLVLDHWKLERAIVIEDLHANGSEILGPVTIPSVWTSNGTADAAAAAPR